MAKKLLLWLAVGAVLAAMAVPAPAYAGDQPAATPTNTPAPLTPAKVGSNAHLAIGALVLVVIILLGVGVNFRRRK